MSSKYSCVKCCYFTNKKQDYDKHIITKKHTNNDTVLSFECKKCSKKFVTNSGLWRHNKVCNGKKEEIKNTVIKDEVSISQQENTNEDKLSKLMSDMEYIKNIISELAKTGQLTPIVTNPTINDHSINSHNKIDINVFLNEKCQNAVNMSSLIKDIMFGAKDIENITKHGYVKAITDRLVDKIGGYSVYERPIHYYIENSKDEPEENEDPPQETIHIKENNKWNTEEIGDHDLLLDNLNTINDVLIEKSKKNELVTSMVKRGKRYDQTKEVIKNVLQTVELNEHQIQTL